MLKFASAGDLVALRGLIAEFYYCTAAEITLDGGEIWKGGRKMSTIYIQKGRRWYFGSPNN